MAGGHTAVSVDPSGSACAVMNRSCARLEKTSAAHRRFIKPLRIQHNTALYAREDIGEALLKVLIRLGALRLLGGKEGAREDICEILLYVLIRLGALRFCVG